MEFINFPILIFSVILVFSILTSFVSSRANIPLILVVLCVGLFFGRGGLGIVAGYHQPKLAFFVGSLALAFILFDSGYQTKFANIRKNLTPAVLLSSFGVFFTAALLAPAAHYIVGFSWAESFLLASIISSSSMSLIAFSIFRGSFINRSPP